MVLSPPEYRGDYVLTQREFKEFHRPRIGALVGAEVDLLACETLPSFAEAEALRDATDKPLIAYPNSGESYDAATKTWRPGASGSGGPSSLAEGVSAWHDLGARLIGGCCRTTPGDIAAVAISMKR